MSITEFKNNTLKSINAMANAGTFLFPTNNTQIDHFKKLITNTNSIEEFIKICPLIQQSIQSSSLFYDGVSPIKTKPEENLAFKINQAPAEWYFMYGKTDTLSFTYIIFRLGTNVLDKNECLYSITGGFGSSGKWEAFPFNVSTGDYKVTDDQITFNYNKIPTILTTQFSINKKKNYEMNCNITIGKTQINFVLTPQDQMHWNGNGGCLPCVGGIGSIYSSFTNMKCTINNELTNGLGWFDHQSIIMGIPHGRIPKLVYSFVQGNKIIEDFRWLWLTIQLPNIQYMIHIILKPTQVPLKKNDIFTNVPVLKYNKDKVDNITGTVQIVDVLSYTNDNSQYIFPTNYKITIEGNEYSLQKTLPTSYVNMPTGMTNWEGLGTVSDGNGADIGSGFLEANNLGVTTENIVKFKLLTNNYLIIILLVLLTTIAVMVGLLCYPKKYRVLLTILTAIIVLILAFFIFI